MKKLFFSLAAILALFSCGQEANYTINGTATGVADATQITLSRMENRKFIPMDSVTVTNGVFKFHGYQPAERYYLSIPSASKPFGFFITGTNETMEIALNIENMSASTITGSALNDTYVAYQKEVLNISMEINQLMTTYNTEVKAIKEDKKLKPADQEKKLKELEEKINTQYDALDNQKNELTKSFILANANNVAGQRVFLQMPYALNTEELTSFVASIQDKTTPVAKEVVQRLENVTNSADGNSFIDVELPGRDDQPVKLSTWLGKGNYVLVDFWASWCGPCRRENPNVVAMYQKYHDKGLDIVGVSRDRDKDKWIEAIDTDGLVWNHVWDKDGVAAQKYVVDFIPTIFLFDKEGKIVARGLHGESLRAKLTEIFGE